MKRWTTLIRSASLFGILSLLLASAQLYAADNQLSDDQVAQEAANIHKAISSLSDYDVFDWVSFDIQGSTVILKGYASRPILKEEVQRVTSKVPGVKQVMNDIKVLPLSTFDDQLRTRLYFNIYGETTLSRYDPNQGAPLMNSPARMESGLTNDPPSGYHPIHIIVDNGNVTLKGVVDTEGDRVLAGMQARTTPGVFSMTNDLAVVQHKSEH